MESSSFAVLRNETTKLLRYETEQTDIYIYIYILRHVTSLTV